MTTEQFKLLKKLFEEYERISNDRDSLSDPSVKVVIELSGYKQIDATKEERDVILKGRIADCENDLTKVEYQMAEILDSPLL
ncbi:hypothetical protein [Dyadobacter bucti]|uniref:hypothetical protein n=1 Tax=Dyadobacter bucti TaxID=2572203 RepID=UPI003F727CFE